jgi:hypothetical protein
MDQYDRMADSEICIPSDMMKKELIHFSKYNAQKIDNLLKNQVRAIPP